MTILNIFQNLLILDLSVNLRQKKLKIFIIFLAAKKVTEVTGGFLLRTSMFPDFPISVSPMISELERATAAMESATELAANLNPGQLEAVVEAKNL